MAKKFGYFFGPFFGGGAKTAQIEGDFKTAHGLQNIFLYLKVKYSFRETSDVGSGAMHILRHTPHGLTFFACHFFLMNRAEHQKLNQTKAGPVFSSQEGIRSYYV